MKKIYDLSYYDYEVPEALIAQRPLSERDACRLLVLERKTGRMTHDFFYNIGGYMAAGDCLVLNDTRVIPARLYGKTETGAKIEILILGRKEGSIWEVMMKNSRRAAENCEVFFDNDIRMTVLSKKGKTAEVSFNMDESLLLKTLRQNGIIPLPPYIKENALDASHRDSYQTVYASNEGAKAAPTAGLHFTARLLRSLENAGVRKAFVTLHVGMGTFEPVVEADIRKHNMHTEEYTVTQEAAGIINSCKGRKIACGTTSLRVLESSVKAGKIVPGSGRTGIYIYPGYSFAATDGLITNFHLPKTTLLALVYAFAGEKNAKKAYDEAIRKKYRLFSYGDAMLII
ncbi:MAG TPA: tRNA preQ1(34) S-adenosylmethionine ribosyltransferase-isomerase QueA [Candidatus Goldiibacteriota bacterium]|nr:tRNA preQ1(34) S-adenosylmethionine ribosyltransferase-isomerase QueA [Candidatus Goldiibacteriota bacterium]